MDIGQRIVDLILEANDLDHQAGQDAAQALRLIARNETVKTYIQRERPVHDALLGAARRFIGGEHLDSCLDIAREINAKCHAVTIDFMGESTRDAGTARGAAVEFQRVVHEIETRGLSASISLDLSHLGLAIDPELAFELTSSLASLAANANLKMMISAEGSERTDAVLAMYERLAERFPNVGITLQTYLLRTAEDLRRVLPLTGRIRIVKGAFDEPPGIAMPRGDTLDARYLSFVEQVIASGRPVSIATHDPVLLDRVVSGVPAGTPGVEVEMLYGVQPERLEFMRTRGFSTRTYLPYGTEWFLYVAHRLAEYPPNMYRAISDIVRGWNASAG